MHWTLMCPAPVDPKRHKRWGDFHFAHSLAKSLRRLGETVSIVLHEHWETAAHDQETDVVLVLRGKHSFNPSLMSSDRVYAVWNISHPDDVSFAEYDAYDVVCVASSLHAQSVGTKLGRDVHTLLQCTDPDVFRARRPTAERRDTVFVGNTRSVRRDLVLWSVDLVPDTRIWGSGWSHFIPKRHVQAQSILNDDVGELYGSCRLVLNDHWPDMRERGFINNRVFDAMAAGAVLLSDRHPALQALFPDEVLYADSRDELSAALERATLAYPQLSRRVAQHRERIADEFSFDARARQLLQLCSTAANGPRPGKRGNIVLPEVVVDAEAKAVDGTGPSDGRS